MVIDSDPIKSNRNWHNITTGRLNQPTNRHPLHRIPISRYSALTICDGRLPLIRLANAKDEIPSRKLICRLWRGISDFYTVASFLVFTIYHLTRQRGKRRRMLYDTTVTICKLQIPSQHDSVCLSVGTCDTSNISCYYCIVAGATDWLAFTIIRGSERELKEEGWKRKYAAVSSKSRRNRRTPCILLLLCINNAEMPTTPRRMKRNLCLICQFAKTQVEFSSS